MLEFTPAALHDAAVAAALVRVSFAKQAELLGLSEHDCPGYVGFETELRTRQRLAAGWCIAVASIAGTRVGTVSWRYRDGTDAAGEIARLAVLPAHRGLGYGRLLMEHAEDQLMSAGASLAALSIVAEFDGLRTYYQTLGYRGTGQSRVPGLPFEILLMKKTLAGTTPLSRP
jgi:GNAT superfamily N-acetyltransferase